MKLFLPQQVYELDRLAILQDGQPALQLMQKAASAVWQSIQLRWPALHKVVVFAGPGNNGGDAFAVASLAKKSGIEVDLFTLGDLSQQSEEASFYRQQWEEAGGMTNQWSGSCPDCDLIVDGMLGIGLNKMLDDRWQSVIQMMNKQPSIKVCIDIPSGLNAATGNPMPCAVQADLTVSFIGRKIGCFLADGPDYCGELVFDDLGLSASAANSIQADCIVLDKNCIRLPAARKHNSHKNHFGHVLVIGGDRGMSGAVRLAAMAALRCGSGLVSLCVHPDNYSVAAAQHAELMVSDWDALPNLLQQASVIVVGPGLGRSGKAKNILKVLHTFDKPMVIDADALTAGFVSKLSSTSVVITPHPGEAARLLGTSAQAIQQDRLDALQQLNNHWPFICVLKGSGTLVGLQNKPTALCSHGHAGMATAGMGDVLAGLIGGYLAQGLNPEQAAQTAVLVHALAAEDFATCQDENSLIASDIIERLSTIVRDIRQSQANS